MIFIDLLKHDYNNLVSIIIKGVPVCALFPADSLVDATKLWYINIVSRDFIRDKALCASFRVNPNRHRPFVLEEVILPGGRGDMS